MSLISLLIALAAERVMVSKNWHFDTYFISYVKLVRGFVSKGEISKNRGNILAFAVVPALILWGLLEFFDSGLVEFIVSTLLLIICLGSNTARESYKNFLNAAMRGDEVAVSHYQMELQNGQQSEQESFGQTLVWVNYRYYMAVMLMFIFFGIAAVVFYRLLVATNSAVRNGNDEPILPEIAVEKSGSLLSVIDFIPVRFVALGYMLVGHFSRALTYWLEGMLNTHITNRRYLCEVAKTSEEITIEEGDLTAEPGFLVRLAKRNVMLLLAATAFMTMAGVIH
ncbi:regulatory signaling modulator protein AmpE [Thalassotalea sp. HSM 43]|uniref:regulatory signaling modulator protein AmpE n=1 Tax=Thalassotalea sp. HSM 43 TaxID=2552945 RepID=UPI0010808215|nr:regulatory signaling modulator protein AmpE [Thalassotalea sp. HSM 43]QBY04844.1 regulatory signaling modulator protein AmpE [Thalassotalea sp. HSM 43]